MPNTTNYIVGLFKELKEKRYWLNFLRNWNKENGKNYISFSNKQTNGNGCMNRMTLAAEIAQLENEIKSKSRKLANYFKNNRKIETNIIFK